MDFSGFIHFDIILCLVTLSHSFPQKETDINAQLKLNEMVSLTVASLCDLICALHLRCRRAEFKYYINATVHCCFIVLFAS